MKGRKPVPTHLKLVRGTARGAEKARSRTSRKKKDIPSCPAHVSDKARETWGHVVGLLDNMGVMTRADALAVEMLCEARADYLAAREELKRRGTNYYETTTPSGATMHRVHPAVAVMQDADRRMKGWLTEFGLTPSARTRVQGEPPEDDDPFSAYF